MLRLVVRRAWVQRRLLSAVVLLVAVAATLLGFYALLLGVTGPKAFSAQVQRTPADDVDATAYVVGLAGPDLPATREATRGVVQQVLAPLHPALISTATSQMRQIGDSGRLGYLATTNRLPSQVSLTSGRWPHDHATGPVEAIAPDVAARLLRLHVGDLVRLGPGPGLGENAHAAVVAIVGTFKAVPRVSAQSDPLSGAGFDPTFTTSGVTAPAYGPFLVEPVGFTSTGFDVEGLRVDAHPDLRTADDASLSKAAGSLGNASALLSSRVGTSADITRMASQLPDTLARLHTQQATTRSAVLVALLLDTMLGIAALVLAGRLLADSRADEHELLTTLGLAPRQRLTASLVEAAVLALGSAVLAVPAAALVFAAVMHLPHLRAAGLAEGPRVTPGLVVTVLAAVASLTLVLVLSPLVGWENDRLSSRRRGLVRSGVDVLLLVVAAVGWWQLHSRAENSSGNDALMVLAPVLFLAALSIVAVRTLPALFALVAVAGSRSRALLPVALNPASLRLSAGTALVLLSMASASATFGIALHTTWQRSQGDQADLRVGTDLALLLDAPPTTEDAERVARATDDSLVSPVITGPVALGHYFGNPGSAPQLVALDTRQAGSVVRGRPGDGTTWSDVGGRLAPGSSVRGVPTPSGGVGVTMTGHAPSGVSVSVTPSVVVQDATGFRSTVDAAPLPVDGDTHPVRWFAPLPPGQGIVAVRLSFTSDGSGGSAQSRVADVSVTMHVPGRSAVPPARWGAERLGQQGVVLAQSVSARRSVEATRLTTHAILQVAYLEFDTGEVLTTAFEPPPAVPVAVSQALVDATGTKVGGQLSATIGDSVVLLHVVEVVPSVPSEPAHIAVLADADTLSRALISAGHLEPAVDAFWVAHPTARTSAALDGLKLGEVTTRAEVASELRRDPLQITLPLAYVTLAGSAVLLLVAAAALVVSADQRRRSGEVARLRALGLSRVGARRLAFAQHGALLLALVLSGVVVGGAAAVALGRRLVRSEEGTAPVPRAVLAWPWASETVVAVVLVVSCLVIAAVAAVVQVRRSDTTQLPTGEV